LRDDALLKQTSNPNFTAILKDLKCIAVDAIDRATQSSVQIADNTPVELRCRFTLQ